jgi:hypothetical protein
MLFKGLLCHRVSKLYHFCVLPCSTDYVKVVSSQWGVLENGRWSGMVGSVLMKEIDVCVGIFGLTSVRSEAVDYFFYTMETRQVSNQALKVVCGCWKQMCEETFPFRSFMFYKSLNSEVTSLDTYFRPFIPGIWLAILETLVLLVLSLTLTHYIERYFESKAQDLCLPDNIFSILACLCQQGELVVLLCY